MIELDGRLRALRDHARAWADSLRPHALEADRDPDSLDRYLELPAFSRVSCLQIPPEYNDDPLEAGGHRYYLMSPLERVVCFEEMARGDLGLLLGAPGAPMAGVLVAELGDDAQKEWFYGYIRKRPTWTFFGLTEPTGGSAALDLKTTLTPRSDGASWLLHGAKRHVGNATRADVGVIFARSGKGPLALRAVLVEAGSPGFTATPVDTLGLRAARLGEITLDSVEVPAERVLGQHLTSTRRGMWGWLRTFNLLRPTVAAMGIGVAQAAYEYVVTSRRVLRQDEQIRLAGMGQRIEAVRQLTRRAAMAVEANPSEGYLASAAKMRAARVAEEVTMSALDFFGPGALLEHPLLEKWARDARGIEYMEGTTNVQRLNVFAGLSRGRLGADETGGPPGSRP
ncbi:acyl-CoA dehydrogenase family protein [Streptomyces europaeiscabiei]|uniref:acyl-CoA dehydrogenase family protein n=1 Tax=Streptomyces europaeiscabiei TaxID=146819 RepID=UPI0029AEB67F|nr:acyl-CoA dehydrogenase family protein [Streptomyces europaeiscabiei]MDX2525307.1 acyl-CoA/acyl-ACP dehydrogenase [Streptomyces europaeiscabiei]